MPVELRPKRIEQQTPMIMELTRDDLLWLINDQLRKQGQAAGTLPANVEITVDVPGGGDYSDEPLPVDKLTFRWKQ